MANGIGDFAADVAEFSRRDIFKTLSVAVEILVNLDSRLLHQTVRFLTAAEQKEVFAAGEPSVAVVVVEAESE